MYNMTKMNQLHNFLHSFHSMKLEKVPSLLEKKRNQLNSVRF